MQFGNSEVLADTATRPESEWEQRPLLLDVRCEMAFGSKLERVDPSGGVAIHAAQVDRDHFTAFHFRRDIAAR